MTADSRLSRAEAQSLARDALAEQHPGHAYGLGCLKNSDRPMRAQVFCAAHPDAHLVVKVYAATEADKARAQAERQRAVAAQLQAGPWRAPQVLFFDEARLVLGMTYAPGPNLAELWPRIPPAKRDVPLVAAGCWLAALHRPTLEPRKLRPRGQLSWLEAQLEAARASDDGFAECENFAFALAALQDLFPQARGRMATRAVTHRDLHLSNLVSATGALWGLDVENAKPDAPYRDLVGLLVDALARSPAPDPRRFGAALARGYGDDTTDPVARLFLQRAYALGVWCRTPSEPSQHQRARLEAAKMILAAESALF
ncbi:phosphotransferase family protein [Alloyangia pacifica]|uniref:phosphotransferase family protein n=1 Tax=Alloyangia pacifica TaxID=311180 RepID=UPI001CD81916|nr:aminoglycoside phosphotransferase family protein [Alloyangia pacifica]MCA0996525.1 aminoglycoside phosphotransferase family protein [Alloyangia pacifica]